MPVEACADCGIELAPAKEPTFAAFASFATRRCQPCGRKARVELLMKTLPKDGEGGWARLTQWERDFLGSVRQQVAQGKDLADLTDPQVEKLEQIARTLA